MFRAISTEYSAQITFDFIHHHEVIRDRNVTYATYILNYKQTKDEKHIVCITVGGDCLTYPYDAGSPTYNLIETKVLLNITISDAKHGALFMLAVIKDYFLATPMSRAEFIKVHSRHIPEDIMCKYNFHNKVTLDGYVCILIKKGMYDLKQAAILAYGHIKTILAPHGYTPVIGTFGLWKK